MRGGVGGLIVFACFCYCVCFVDVLLLGMFCYWGGCVLLLLLLLLRVCCMAGGVNVALGLCVFCCHLFVCVLCSAFCLCYGVVVVLFLLCYFFVCVLLLLVLVVGCRCVVVACCLCL